MKLEGELQQIDIFRHLRELGEARFTGAIRFEHDAIIKILYFKEGEVLSASTNDRTDSVDEILLRAGKVTRDHIRQALGRRKENETLGDALLGLGFITRKELAWGRRAQIVGIVRSIQSWPGGSFQVVQDYLPKREEGTSFHLPQILLELVVTDPDRAGIERQVDGGSLVFRRTSDFQERYEKLALNEDADAIAEQVDAEKTAAEIAASSGLETFAVYKLLLALEKLGLLAAHRPQVTHEVSPELPSASALIDPAFEPLPPLEEPPQIRSGLDDGFEIRADELRDAIETDDQPPYEADLAGQTSVEAEDRERSSRNALLLVVALLVILGGGAWAGYRWLASGEPNEPVDPGMGAIETTEPVEEPGATSEPVQPPLETSTAAAPVTEGPPAAEPPRVNLPPVISEAAPAPVTPMPAAPPDPLRQRYQAMAERFARENRATEYAVQFEIVCETASVTRALTAGEQVWFTPIRYRNRPCFRVFWGKYTTPEAAERAKREIPAELRGSGPVVVRPKEILR